MPKCQPNCNCGRHDTGELRRPKRNSYRNPPAKSLSDECKGIRHSLNEFGWLSHSRMDRIDREVLAMLATRLQALEDRLVAAEGSVAA